MAFISVFRELSEVILFYIALFQGDSSQKTGTLYGIIVGSMALLSLIYCYQYSTDRWKKVNRIIFDVTPFFMLMLAIMCIGNAISAFQEAGWLGFTPLKWMGNSNFFHIQASEEYLLSVTVFLCCTGPLFIKQFYRILVKTRTIKCKAA